jgi:hypothetical protein
MFGSLAAPGMWIIAVGLAAAPVAAGAAHDFRAVIEPTGMVFVIDAASIAVTGTVRTFILYAGPSMAGTPVGDARVRLKLDCATGKARMIAAAKAQATGDGFEPERAMDVDWTTHADDAPGQRIVHLVCADAKDRDRYAPSFGDDWRGAMARARTDAGAGQPH